MPLGRAGAPLPGAALIGPPGMIVESCTAGLLKEHFPSMRRASPPSLRERGGSHHLTFSSLLFGQSYLHCRSITGIQPVLTNEPAEAKTTANALCVFT